MCCAALRRAHHRASGWQVVTSEDAEDAVELLRYCLMDKLLDEAGVIDFRKTGTSSKQARSSCHRSPDMHMQACGLRSQLICRCM